MDGTEGLVRGNECVDIGSPIRIPVGRETLGRIINVIGDPIDERGPVNATRFEKFALYKGQGSSLTKFPHFLHTFLS